MNDIEHYHELREKHAEPREQRERVCRHCGGRGVIPIERGSSTVYPCPDCRTTEEADSDDDS